MRRFKQLTITDRNKIETLFLAGLKAKEIASAVRVHVSTIYRELKRGMYMKLTTHLEQEVSYSCDLGQARHDTKMRAKGVSKKIASDPALAKYIERKIADEHYSPEAVLGEIAQQHLKFSQHICVTTLYSYIDKGVFERVSNRDLPVKSQRKRGYQRVHPRQHKILYGTSIEKRDESILSREEFGHWEMDTVKGKVHSKCSLLVFTERKTRKELIFKLEHHDAQNVVAQLDKLEKKLKKNFAKIFKSITCDNGTEFARAEDLERSCIYKNKKRTNVYYCHPYTSCERGSNEVANKLIRRHIPKGTCFDDISIEKVKNIEKWMNGYPRRIFSYRTADDMFKEEISSIPELSDLELSKCF